ncbi:hypothetical protein C9374_010573 [Naegleria lovaniensis]|uniref:DUF4460 domain-containing protein n=1 Tax=Naegleria lovaniensis TaxID=51637 RepID=A0AA88KFI3_NAELO|nr:uncharacterized protein C9374_010573 [Naegleria lovaniensis]KAG2374554.1 hypothetical protein C9374_010573 [Naegleria lovaniensis]
MSSNRLLNVSSSASLLSTLATRQRFNIILGKRTVFSSPLLSNRNEMCKAHHHHHLGDTDRSYHTSSVMMMTKRTHSKGSDSQGGGRETTSRSKNPFQVQAEKEEEEAFFTPNFNTTSTKSSSEQEQPQSIDSTLSENAESYTKILKKFFLKVHPDFFHQDAVKQQQNKESFSKLNELLNWSNEYLKLRLDDKNISEDEKAEMEQRLHRLGNIPSVGDSFVFYVREQSRKVEPYRIEVVFALSSKLQFNGKLKSRLMLTQRLEELVTSLLEKSKIITESEARYRREAALEQFKQMEEDSTQTGKRSYRSLKDELRMALQNNLQGAVNLEKLRRGEEDDTEAWWWDMDVPTIEHLITHGMIFFSKHLSPEQTIKAMTTLKEGLAEMRYFEWSDIPLMITERTEKYAVNDPVDGFICIPYNFNTYDFTKQILDNQKNMKLLIEKRELTRKKAETIQNIREKLIEEVGLSDLAISPTLTSDQLYTFIENFEKRYLTNEKLKLVLKDLCLIVDSKYTASPDGFISIHWNFLENGRDNFIEFLRDLGAQKLKSIKDMGKALVAIRKSIATLGEEIIGKLKCKEFNLNKYSDFEGAILEKHQLLPLTNEFLKKLRECCLFLERFDWSTYSFFMVNTLSAPKDLKLPFKHIPNVQTQTDIDNLMRRLTIYGDTVIDMGDRVVYIPINFNENQLFKCVQAHWKEVNKTDPSSKEHLASESALDFSDVVDPQGFQNYRNLANMLVEKTELVLSKKRAERYKILAEYLNHLEDAQLYGKSKQVLEIMLDDPEDQRFVELYQTWFRIKDVPLEDFETSS